MRKPVIALISLALLCPIVMAGPLNKARVASNAKWLAHVDFEAILASDLAQIILAEAETKQDFNAKLDEFEKIVGFDPLKNARSMTLYGLDFTEGAGVAVLDITADQGKLLGLLKKNEAYRELSYGKRAVYQWTDQDKAPAAAKTKFGCFYNRDLMIVASSIELLKGAIDVLDAKADSLERTKSLKSLPTPVAGTFIVAAAEGFPIRLKKDAPHAALTRSVTGASFQLVESRGVMSAKIAVQTKTPENALSIRQVVQGFVALGQMMKQQEQFRGFQNLGEAILVGGQGAEATLNATIPTKSLIEAAVLIKQRRGEKRARGAASEKTN